MKCKYCKKLYSRVDGHVCQHHAGMYAAQQKIKKILPKPQKG